jgi:3-hydroxyisobutyrate dehydrogenase-like beta-hydroxyacid dehydrogenase
MKVGYIGLGTMGEPMAANVLRAGFDLTAFDVRPEPVERLVALGADAGASVAEVGATSEVILVNVVNDLQVEEVVFGTKDDGLLSTAPAGAVVVVHSTVHPQTCRRLADALATRDIRIVDAPFTGGLAGARAGTLALLVGGDADAVETCRTVLSAMGTVKHLGAVGSGELAKLGNNLVIAITLQAVNEALRLASSVGLDEATMLDVLCSGAASSWTSQNWVQVGEMAKTYPGGIEGLANLTYKDISLALSVAHDHGVTLPVAALTSQRLLAPYELALRNRSPQEEQS